VLIDESSVEDEVSAIDIDVDDPVNLGLVMGYEFDSGLGLELQYTDSVDSGQLAISRFRREIREDFDYRTFALYGVYRTDGDFYFKAKAGVLWEEIDTDSVSEDESGFSAGIGAGYRFGSKDSPTSIELEYTIAEEDIDVVSLGLRQHF